MEFLCLPDDRKVRLIWDVDLITKSGELTRLLHSLQGCIKGPSLVGFPVTNTFLKMKVWAP